MVVGGENLLLITAKFDILLCNQSAIMMTSLESSDIIIGDEDRTDYLFLLTMIICEMGLQ